jgi:hypothetical protein
MVAVSIFIKTTLHAKKTAIHENSWFCLVFGAAHGARRPAGGPLVDRKASKTPHEKLS